MKPLDKHSFDQLVELMTPLVSTTQDRYALLVLTFVDHPLIERIDYAGSTMTFLPRMLDSLYQFGMLDDGRPALWALLEVVREQVGLEQKHRIDALRPIFDLPPPIRLDRVFVSYSRKNERDARRIVSDLKDAGLRVWYDREKIKGGDDWWQSIVRGITHADYFIFCLSPDSIRSQVARDELLLARQHNKPIFAVMLQDCFADFKDEGFAAISWLPKLHIIQFTQPERYADSLRELIQSLPGYTPPDGYFIDQYDARDLPNPFRGLEAFLEVDAAYFAGREGVVQDLLARLNDPGKPRLLAVVGASGSGKSSLVRAGLIPALRQALPFWETLVMKPGSHPLDALADRLQERLGSDAAHTRDQLRTSGSALDDIAADLLSGKPEDARFVVVVDQFEEVFTLTGEDERQRFLDQLLYAVTRASGQVQIILTLRADFFNRLSALPELAGLIRENLDIATDMTPDQLRHSIEDPAHKVGVDYEDGLVDILLEDVRTQPGSLPLLQYALKELFDRKQGRHMTRAAYDLIGGVKGALATRAEAIHDRMRPEEQVTLRRILLRLVEVGEDTVTRRRVTRSDLTFTGVSEGVVQIILDQLTSAEARLLVVSAPLKIQPASVEDDVFYEVSHEALLTHWERLATWITENRDDLRRSSEVQALAQAWQATNRQDESFLLLGGRLEAAREWLERGDASRLQQDFVNASSIYHAAQQQHELELQRRALNRTRLLAASFGVFLVVAIALMVFAFDNQNNALTAASNLATQVIRADDNAATSDANVTVAVMAQATAERQADESLSLALASSARDAMNSSNGDLALALVVEANRIDAPPGQAVRILSEIAQMPGARMTIDDIDSGVYQVAISPDQQMLATGGGYGEVHLRNLQTGQMLFDLAGRESLIIVGLGFSQDGKRLFAVTGDLDIRVWDVISGEQIDQFAVPAGQHVVFSPQENSVLLGDINGDIYLVDLYQGITIRQFTGHTDRIHDLIFSLDGRIFASSAYDNTIRVWDTQTGQAIQEIAVVPISTAHGLGRIAIMPDTRSVLLVTYATEVYIWDIETGEQIRDFEVATGGVLTVKLSPDGQQMVITEPNGLSLWDMDTGRLAHRFRADMGNVHAVGFIEADALVSGSTNGQIRVWDLKGQLPDQHINGYNDIHDLAFFPNNQLVSAAQDGVLRQWDLASGSLTNSLKLESSYWPVFITTNPAMTRLLATYSDSSHFSSVLWDTETHQIIRRYDKATVASSFVDDTQVVSVILSKSICPYPICRPAVWTIALSLELWDIETGNRIRIFHDPAQTDYGTFDLSPDRSLLVGSGGYVTSDGPGYKVSVWDVATGKKIRDFGESKEPFSNIKFSPDGCCVLVGTTGGTVQLWDVTSGEQRFSFAGHTNFVRQVDFSPDGQIAVSGSLDGSVRFWSLATGEQIRQLNYDSSVLSVEYSSDGRYIAVGLEDGNIYVYRQSMTLDELLAWTYSHRYVRALTCAERIQYGMRDRCDAAGTLPEPQFAVTISPAITDATQAPASLDALLTATPSGGLPYSTTLIKTDLPNNPAVQFWSLAGNAGERITIELTTTDFDPYLILKDASGSVLTSDDDSGEGVNATIHDFELPSTGRYILVVDSYASGQGKGTYDLRLTVSSDKAREPLQLEPLALGLFGIGWSKGAIEEAMTITTVVTGSAAHQAGILVDDIVLRIDGEEVSHLTYRQTFDILRLPPDYIRVVTVQRGATVLDIEVTTRQ